MSIAYFSTKTSQLALVSILGRLIPTARNCLVVAVVVVTTLFVNAVQAAPDEIVIFDDEFEKPREIGYQLHLNFANRSRTTPDYPGEQPPNRILRFMPEVAVGLSETWNLGVHVPMSHDLNVKQTTVDGVKVRLTNLNVRELGNEETIFYGANYELSYYHHRLSESRWVAELRGILGWRSADWLVAVNPILNRPLNNVPGVDNHVNLDLFAKIMREVGKGIAVGLEHYAELGRLRSPVLGAESGQTTYAVAQFPVGKGFEFHLGLGHGWTNEVDKRVYKAIIGFPF